MPTEMLDRLQEDKLQGLEALIHSYETATTTGGGEDEAAAIADFFVDEGIGVRQSSQRLWDYHWTRALAGKTPDGRERGAKLLVPAGTGRGASFVVVRHLPEPTLTCPATKSPDWPSLRNRARRSPFGSRSAGHAGKCWAGLISLSSASGLPSRRRPTSAARANLSPRSSPGWSKAGLWSRNKLMRRLIIWPGISRRIGACRPDARRLAVVPEWFALRPGKPLSGFTAFFATRKSLGSSAISSPLPTAA